MLEVCDGLGILQLTSLAAGGVPNACRPVRVAWAEAIGVNGENAALSCPKWILAVRHAYTLWSIYVEVVNVDRGEYSRKLQRRRATT